MYRKMIFIFFTIMTSIGNQQKTLVLLFFAAASLFFTMKNRPFVVAEMNSLELQSNFTAIISIFAGSLYILDINDFLKALAFIVIVTFNTVFAIRWLFSVSEIFLYLYAKRLIKFCPSFFTFIAALNQSHQNTKFTYNIPCYIFKFIRTFSKIKGNLCVDLKNIKKIKIDG